jgi:hypothetical protein
MTRQEHTMKLRMLVKKSQVRGRITAAISNPAWRGEEGEITEYAWLSPYPFTFRPDVAPQMRLDLREDEVEVLQ